MSGYSAAQRRPASRKEIALTVGMLIVTVVASLAIARDMLLAIYHASSDVSQMARTVVFATVLFILVYGNLVYLVTRLGHFARRMRHRPPVFETLVDTHWEEAKPIAVLVPSYKEDVRTIRQTLLSAALQHHPNKRVVLLLDDPPHPKDRESSALLKAARQVPGEIAALLLEPKGLIERASARFSQRRVGSTADCVWKSGNCFGSMTG